MSIASVEGARLHLSGLGPFNSLAKFFLAEQLGKKMKETLKIEAERKVAAVVGKYSILENFYKMG